MDEIMYCCLLCGTNLTYTYRMCNNCTNTYCSECCKKQIYKYGEKYINNMNVLNQCDFCHIYKSDDLFLNDYEFKMFDIPYEPINDNISTVSTDTTLSDTTTTDTTLSDTTSTNSSNTECIVYDTQILDYILWKINKTREEIVQDMFEENML